MKTISTRRVSMANQFHHRCESRMRAAPGRGGVSKRPGPGIPLSRRRLKTVIGSLLLLACLVVPVQTVLAADITVERAISVAEGWLKATRDPLGAPMQRNVLAVSELRNDQGDTVCFVVTLHPTGYMIISPDDEIEPVIAFSPLGRYDASPENPLRRLLEEDLPGRSGNLKNVRNLNDFVLKKIGKPIKFTSDRAKLRSRASERWNDLAEIGESESFSESSGGSGLFEVSDDRVSPLVESRWSQGTVAGEAVFNYYTPNVHDPATSNCSAEWNAGDPDNEVSGCVATALSQVLRFHRYPDAPVPGSRHTVRLGKKLSSPYYWASEVRALRGSDGSGGGYDWNSMVLVPESPYVNLTGQQRQAIGALTYDTGVAVGMNYTGTSSGSGTDTLLCAEALTDFFSYGNAVKGYNAGSNIGTGLNSMINPNLDSGRPVLLGVTGTSGGHAIVCDGYGYHSETLYHHLNMGWAGTDDVWYNLPDVSAGIQFNSVHKAVYNIYKSGSGEIISGRVLDGDGNPVADATVTAVKNGGGSYQATTNDRGIYALVKLPSNATFSITVGRKFYESFSPQNREVSSGSSSDYGSTSGNRWGIDFEGDLEAGPAISGYVRRSDGKGIAGVTMDLSNSGGTATTDSGGFYYRTVPQGWSGTVSPGKAGYVISPSSRSYVGVTSLITGANFVGASPIFVDAGATGKGDGTSWDDAYTDLQEALTIASDGDEVWVAEGTYKPGTSRKDTFQLKLGVELYGGFTGTETDRSQRDWNDHRTVLSGDIGVQGLNSDNSYHVVTGRNEAVLDGFVVTLGYADGGGEDGRGGGMYNKQQSPIVRNCTFSRNHAAGWGGGMYCSSAYPAVQRCIFLGNTAGGYGGGMSASGASPTVADCVFSGNTAGKWGGGIFNYNNAPVVRNGVFSGNTATEYGGGMCNYGSSPAVTNCTFFGNTATTYYGGALANIGNANSVLTNCILWGNSGNSGVGNQAFNESSTATYSYCVFEGGVLDYPGSSLWYGNGAWGDPDYAPADAGGNITDDPLFRNAGNQAGADGVFRTFDDGLLLSDGSPCMDAGDGNAAPETDILGNSRVDSSNAFNTGTGAPDYVDMGAYEGGTGPEAPVVSGDTPTDDSTPTWTWVSGGGGNGTYRYKLDDSDMSSGATGTTSTGYTPVNPLSAGTHTLYVQERDEAGSWSSSGSKTILINIEAPNTPVVSGDNPTNDSTPTWSWVSGGGGNGTYRYKLDSENLFVDSIETASLSYTPESALSEGTHTLYVQERNEAGTWSPSGSRVIVIDVTAPGAPVVSGDTPVNDTTPGFSWISGGGGGGGGPRRQRDVPLPA